jgi:hypothetical protein
MDKIYIGSSPYECDCAQVGSPDYHWRSKVELQAFKEQLERLFPAPEGARYDIAWSNHDYGRYGEVVAVFDPTNEVHTDWAFLAEDGCATWDEQALEKILQAEKTRAEQMTHKKQSWEDKALSL